MKNQTIIKPEAVIAWLMIIGGIAWAYDSPYAVIVGGFVLLAWSIASQAMP